MPNLIPGTSPSILAVHPEGSNRPKRNHDTDESELKETSPRSPHRVESSQNTEPLRGRRARGSWEWRDPFDPWESAAYGEATGRGGWYGKDNTNATRRGSRVVQKEVEHYSRPGHTRSSYSELASHTPHEPTLDHKGDDSGRKRKPESDPFYDQVFYIMTKTSVGFYFDVWQALLSVLACGVYVWTTYYFTAQELHYPLWLVVFECVCTAFFVVDFGIHLYLAPSRSQFITSGPAIIDVLSIAPIFVVFFPDAKLGFVRLLRGVRVLRILRINRLFATSQPDQADVVQQQILLVIFKLVAFMFICAGALHTIDDVYMGEAFSVEEFFYFDALYFVIISVSTVGFGDINPTSDISKLIVMLMICTLMAIVPRELNALASLMDRTSPYDAAFYPQPEAGHVVLCGKPSAISVAMFLREFYHADHGEQRTRVVILDPEEPSEAMKEVIEDQYYNGEVKYVQYVKGSVMSVTDLFKVLAFEASAIFIFSDVFTNNRDSSDLDCILSSKAVGSLVDVERRGTTIPTFIQLLKSSTTDHCKWATSSDSKNAITQNICIETLKMGLMATSVRCPGFAVLLSNLIVSTGEFENLDGTWLAHYTIGYGQEIYVGIEMSPYFLGWTFSEMAAEAFKKFGVCVFAITIPEVEELEQDKETFINPSDYVLLGVETCCLIADDIGEARSFSCHVPPRKRPMAKPMCDEAPEEIAPVETAAEEEERVQASSLHKHIILCGKFFGLRSFVEPLRKVTDQPVVVLHPEPLAEEDQVAMEELTNVYYHQGNPLLLDDLVAAGGGTCEAVIIFSDYTSYFFSPTGGHTTDTFAVFVASSIDANFNCRWCIELVDGSSMRFLSERPVCVLDPHSLYPQYCAGRVYLANIFDSLMAQAFYNDSLIEIITTLINGGDVSDELGAAPREFVVLATSEKAVVDQVTVSPTERSVLHMVEVPQAYVGRTYCDFFFDLMLNHHCLSLGLYCGVTPEGDNTLPFVFSNPPQKTLLHKNDKVYILGDSTPPKGMKCLSQGKSRWEEGE